MIPVQPGHKPTNFDTEVRQKGEAFLSVNPHPKGHEWHEHKYWKCIERALYDTYSGICAYSCTWISRVTVESNVEHFKPRSKYPCEAYNWENYRLACWKLNRYKGTNEEVLDPFTIGWGWFVIDFDSLMIFPGDDLSLQEANAVTKTIKRLKLNEDEDIIEERKKWLQEYVTDEISFEHLQKKAPFIASELTRQGYQARTDPRWARYRKYKDC